jgi:hypothetical protein
MANAFVSTTPEEQVQKVSLLLNAGLLSEAAAELTKFNIEETFYGLLLRGKLEFKLGNFKNTQSSLMKAGQLIDCVPSGSERDDCERQLTMWLHKSQIELNTDKKYAGDINAAAFLPSTRVDVKTVAQSEAKAEAETK